MLHASTQHSPASKRKKFEKFHSTLMGFRGQINDAAIADIAQRAGLMPPSLSAI